MGDEVFLPGAEAAQVPDEKLRDYVLDPEHFLGRHKARVFASVLGIRRDDWRYLRDQIQDRVVECPVSAIRPKPPHGVEYEVRIAIEGLNGQTHPVITGWLAPEEGPPRLLTAYVELRPGT
jgi:filamentous hemagglutinin